MAVGPLSAICRTSGGVKHTITRIAEFPATYMLNLYMGRDMSHCYLASSAIELLIVWTSNDSGRLLQGCAMRVPADVLRMTKSLSLGANFVLTMTAI